MEIGKYLSQSSRKPRVHGGYRAHLKETKTDVVINYLPVGSEMATSGTLNRSDAGCGMVNCIPVFIGSTEYWGKRFADKHLPIIGMTSRARSVRPILHGCSPAFSLTAGVRPGPHYQLNFGGTRIYEHAGRSAWNRRKSRRPAQSPACALQLIRMTSTLAQVITSLVEGPQILLYQKWKAPPLGMSPSTGIETRGLDSPTPPASLSMRSAV